MREDFLLEIATTDFESTAAAVAGGADRIELCTALSEGGLTPSYGLMHRCRKSFSLPIFPIIRPRGGDFFYSADEFAVMLEDIGTAKRLGFEGVVVGALTADGNIDWKQTEAFIQAAYPMEITFHRAFDRCVDPFAALEQLIKVGCTRILTSGQQPAAPEGAALIQQLVEKAAGRIVVMPGSGVRPNNLEKLITQTGATEFHSSAKTKITSAMQHRHPAFAASAESYSHPGVSAEEVKKMKTILNSFASV